MDPAASSWYVARTRHGAEIGVRNRLSALGVENFVPTRRRKASRGRTAEEPLLTCLVFLKATRSQALDLIHFQGVKADYMFDCATHRMMVVPDKQMEDFIQVCSASNEEVLYLSDPSVKLRNGAKVRVINGPFMGVEGTVVRIKKSRRIMVEIPGIIAAASAYVPMDDLEII